MKQKNTLIALCLAALFGTAQAARVDKSITIQVNGETRTYWLYVPDHVKANAPLIFSLHGTGGHSTDKSPFRSSVADTNGCIVVYPQGKDLYFPVFGGTLPGWQSVGTTSSDIEFFKAIIKEVDSNYSIDHKRIYCCGFSNGGMMTYTVANVASDTFAAFCSISGYPINEFHLHHTGRPVPFLHIHGKADDFVRYALVPNVVDNIVARNGANPVPVKTTAEGKYTKSVYEAADNSFPYIYYEIDGMGHNDFTSNTEDGNSALTMWKFMSQYTLDTPSDTTLRFLPRLEQTGCEPKKHGWKMNTGTIALAYGDQQKTDANQNVYRSLQLENGIYKLTFHTECSEKQTLTVRLSRTTAPTKTVVNEKVETGGDATIFINNSDGWGEYKLTITRSKTSAPVTFSHFAIHTSTTDEATAIRQVNATSATMPYTVYTLNGIKQKNMDKGLQIVRMADGNTKKILRP